MPDSTTEKWSSLDEIAGHLGVSKDTVYRWIANKQMPAHKIGRLWKFKISEVDEWVKKGKINKLMTPIVFCISEDKLASFGKLIFAVRQNMKTIKPIISRLMI